MFLPSVESSQYDPVSVEYLPPEKVAGHNVIVRLLGILTERSLIPRQNVTTGQVDTMFTMNLPASGDPSWSDARAYPRPTPSEQRPFPTPTANVNMEAIMPGVSGRGGLYQFLSRKGA